MEENKETSNGQVGEAAENAQDPGNISQVRDILFGSKSREIDRKLARLEERIDESIQSLENETRKRFDALEKVIRSEIASLGDRIATEERERTENLKKLDQSFQDKINNSDRRISQCNDTIAKAERTVRELLLEQIKVVRDELQQSNSKVRRQMDSEFSDVRRTKLDAEGLSELFREFSVRLTDELEGDG